MTKITKTSLPNGVIPFHGIRDQQAKEAIMKINENITALKRCLDTVCNAVSEIQRSV